MWIKKSCSARLRGLNHLHQHQVEREHLSVLLHSWGFIFTGVESRTRRQNYHQDGLFSFFPNQNTGPAVIRNDDCPLQGIFDWICILKVGNYTVHRKTYFYGLHICKVELFGKWTQLKHSSHTWFVLPVLKTDVFEEIFWYTYNKKMCLFFINWFGTNEWRLQGVISRGQTDNISLCCDAVEHGKVNNGWKRKSPWA